MRKEPNEFGSIKARLNREFPFRSPSLVLIAALLLPKAMLSGATATINIDATKPGPGLNPRMYGIFLEEINFGVDGKGYDAQFSRFGYVTNGLPSWRLVKEGGAEGSMHLELEKPLTPATPR